MSQKKSEFSALQTIDDAATLDFVVNGQNFKITKADFLAAMGVTGTLTQEGAVTGTPVLDVTQTPNYLLRNIEDGPGVKASVSPENGLTIEHNLRSGSTGVAVFTNTSEVQPLIRGLLAGNNVSITVDGDALQIDANIGTVPNTVVVQSASDFPVAAAGIRVLPASNPAVYIIKGAINLGTDVIHMEGGNLISGDTSAISSITTNSASPTITANNGGFNACGLEGTAGLRIDNTGGGAAVRAEGTDTILLLDTLFTGVAGTMLELHEAIIAVVNWTGINIVNGMVMTGANNSGPLLDQFNPVAATGKAVDLQGNVTSGTSRLININASSLGNCIDISGDILAIRISGSTHSTNGNALNVSGNAPSGITSNDASYMSTNSYSIDLRGSLLGAFTMAECNITSVAVGFEAMIGDASSANITSSASVTNSRFDGPAGSLSGITKKDLKWFFSGVVGVDDSVRVGCEYISTPAQTTINTINVWERVLGTTTTCPTLERFSSIGNNSLQYDGVHGLSAATIVSLTATKSGATKNYEFAVAVDGVIDVASIQPAEIKSTVVNVSLVTSLDLQTNEEVGIWVRNISDTDNIDINTMNVVVR
jgi:hypothetical protein